MSEGMLSLEMKVPNLKTLDILKIPKTRKIGKYYVTTPVPRTAAESAKNLKLIM